MKKGTTRYLHAWGILIIVVAIGLGLVVGSFLYQWEVNSRALAGAQAATPPAQPGATPDTTQKESPVATPQPTPVAQPTRAPSTATAPEATKAAPVSTPSAEATPQSPAPAATSAPAQTAISFKKDVQPLFQKSCIFCHGAAGGLDLKDYNSLMTTGTNKPEVVPGKPEDSRLVKRLEGQPSPMPPGVPLPASDIQKIKQWITEGAANN